MLLTPSTSTYQLGLRTLRRQEFNFTHGFDLVGRPRSVLPVSSVARADVKRLRDSRMYRMNTWDVVCGDADQGLFVYVFLIRQKATAFAYPVRDNGFRVHHFYALHKPWGKKTRCLEYYAFLRDAEFMRHGRTPSKHTRTHCMRKLEEKRGCLEANLLTDGEQRRQLCVECARNGQKSTCPMRRRAQHSNGTIREWMMIDGTPQCPTSSTRWWVF